jgi:hypothetical protein
VACLAVSEDVVCCSGSAKVPAVDAAVAIGVGVDDDGDASVVVAVVVVVVVVVVAAEPASTCCSFAKSAHVNKPRESKAGQAHQGGLRVS